MKKLVSIFLVLCLTAALFVVPASAAAERRGIVYVATNGKDTNEGTIDSPLATLPAARDKIRAMKKTGQYDGYTVYVRGGNYNVKETLSLSADDSGTDGNPVVWRNYGDEVVTFTGGVNVSGKSFYKVTDKAILDRIVTESARDNIYALDLKKYGVTNFGEPYLLGAYSYYNEIPTLGFATRPQAPDMELLFNEVPMTVARYPNEGYMKVDKVLDAGDHTAHNQDPNFEGKPFTIGLKEDRIKYWTKSVDDMLMYGFWLYDWADQTVPVAKMDPDQKTITSKWFAVFRVQGGANYYIYNLIEELDAPGEYFIDRKNAIVYIVPSGDIEKAQVTLISFEDPLFKTDSRTKNVTFKGLNVLGTRNNAFVINGENIKIVNCDIKFASGAAGSISGKNCGVTDSHISEVTGGWYLSGGDMGTLTPANNYVMNCEFERFSRLIKTYRPAVSVSGVGQKVLFNEFHDSPHQAVAYAGQNMDIMYNEFYDVVNESDDAAAVYGGQTWEGRGINVKFNYFHDMKSSVAERQGIKGVYGDDGQSGMNVIGNVFENIDGSPVWMNGGSYINVYNNFFINTAQGAELNHQMLNYVEGNTLDAMHFAKSAAAKDTIYASEEWREQFPEYFELMDMTTLEKCTARNNKIVNNVAIGTEIGTTNTKNFWDIDQNLIVYDDPGFVDMENRDYTVKADSELFEKLPGFQAIPFTRMGRCIDRAEARAQSAILMSIGSPKSLVNGKILKIDDSDAVVPFIEDSRTYIPLRFLAESLGATVEFNDGLITITTPTISLELTLGSTAAKKNGQAFTLEKVPVVIDGRTLVPLREVSEMLDKKVFWHEAGFISISDDAELFDAESDYEIIDYLHEQIKKY